MLNDTLLQRWLYVRCQARAKPKDFGFAICCLLCESKAPIFGGPESFVGPTQACHRVVCENQRLTLSMRPISRCVRRNGVRFGRSCGKDGGKMNLPPINRREFLRLTALATGSVAAISLPAAAPVPAVSGRRLERMRLAEHRFAWPATCSMSRASTLSV